MQSQGQKFSKTFYSTHKVICCCDLYCSQGKVGCQNVLQQHVIYCVPVHPGLEQTWTGLDWINGCHSTPQYLSFKWFIQLQTNKFHGLFIDFSRTNYNFQGLRFI